MERGLQLGAFGERRAVFDIQDRLDRNYTMLVHVVAAKRERHLRLRPFFPSSASPEVGCLLSHMIVRSYGDSQTHRLCLVP